MIFSKGAYLEHVKVICTPYPNTVICVVSHTIVDNGIKSHLLIDRMNNWLNDWLLIDQLISQTCDRHSALYVSYIIIIIISEVFPHNVMFCYVSYSDLSMNELTKFPRELLRTQNRLVHLYLQRNHITALDETMFKGLHSLASL